MPASTAAARSSAWGVVSSRVVVTEAWPMRVVRGEVDAGAGEPVPEGVPQRSSRTSRLSHEPGQPMLVNRPGQPYDASRRTVAG